MAKDELGLSRRGFLQSAGGALVTAPLASSLAAQSLEVPLPELPGKKLGYAVVGLGSLAINQILPGIAKAKRSKVVALVSGHPDKAKHLAKIYGVDEKSLYDYRNYDTLAANPAVDVVYVVLPNSMHKEYTLRALKAGKHVLCEKPLATTVADGQEMVAAAKAANKKLMTAYRLRYEPNNIELIKYAQDAATYGPTKAFFGETSFNIGDPNQWRLKKAMSGGGSLMDIGIYSLNAARYVTGEEPVEVNAIQYSTPGDPRFTECEETVLFQLRFPSGVLANCSSSFGFGVNRYRVHKANAWAELEPSMNYGGLRMRTYFRGITELQPDRQVDHFMAEMDHFSEMLMAGKDPLTPGEEGVQDLKLIAAIYEAARSGKTIKIA